MAPKNFFDLVKLALPEDVHPRELLALSPEKWWDEKPYLASAHALRKCPRINWDAYLAQNPDVKNAKMDPFLHFLRHGIHEGRKLSSWNRLKQPEKAGSPLVSIVLINFNNGHLPDKCIGSVLGQTLRNIELIVVDDCSTDNSVDIIRGYAQNDKRVKLLVNERNSATLITRKRGVEAARGRYLMFLDSDDYLAPNACEVAVNAISLGYDMVKFGADVVNSLNAPRAAIEDTDDFCNRGEADEYFNDQIITGIFRYARLGWHIWAYIYLRELAVAGFGELHAEYATGPDDLYGLLAIASHARSLLKINERLLYYNFGLGLSATYDKAKVLKYAPAICNTICAVRRYSEKYSLNIGINNLYRNLSADLLERLLPAGSDADVAACFNQLADKLGFSNVLDALLKRHAKHQERIAALIQPLGCQQNGREINHVGIFFPRLHYGAESMIISLCNLLDSAGYQVTLFAEEKSERILPLPGRIKTVYIGQAGWDQNMLLRRLHNFGDAARDNGIDLMIHAAVNVPWLLWDLMAMRSLRIPVIFLNHFNFAWSFSERGAELRPKMEAAFRSADAVICLSRMEELYERMQGINAIYLPPAIKQHPYEERPEVPQKIAVLGRLGDPVKQTGESLKIMHRVVSKAPWVRMYLIGDFYTDEQRREYKQILKEYGLERNVILTGLTDKPEQFLRECGVLLSVSAWEGFPMNIAEAQALGLPCVIYDIPIEIMRDNPSIIAVPQGDSIKACEAILDLIGNAQKWQALSRMAMSHSGKYAPEEVAKEFKKFLKTLLTSCPVSQAAREDYAAIIRYGARYSGMNFTGKWQDPVDLDGREAGNKMADAGSKISAMEDGIRRLRGTTLVMKTQNIKARDCHAEIFGSLFSRKCSEQLTA